MRTCQDCGKNIEYGRGFGGGGVCPSCRGKRAAASAKRQSELAGRVHGNNRNNDPLNHSQRGW